MAIAVTDNRTTVDEFDVATNLSSPVAGEGLTQFTSDPDPKELTAHYGMAVSTEESEILATISSVNLSAGVLIYVWVLPLGTMDLVANYGVSMVIGDGTNTNAYQVAGGEKSVFRHSTDQPSYQCMVLDTGGLPTGKALRGTFASLSLTAVTEFGANYKTLSKALGGASNCFTDMIRYGNGGLTIIGTDSASYWMDDLSVLDSANTSAGAYGICRDLGGGIYGFQGQILLGDTGTGADTLRIIDQTFLFENRGLGTDKYGLTVQGNSTGAQAITFTNSNFLVPVGVGAFFLATNINVENLDATGCLFTNWDQGFSLSADATNAPNWDWSNSKFVGCSQINSGKTAFKDNTIENTTDANGGWIIDTNTSLTNVSGLKFISDGTGHAIYITATGSYTFTDFTYTGYGADGTTDAVVYNNSGGAVTITQSGGNSITVRNGTSATTTIVTGAVDTTINVFNTASPPVAIENARVIVWVTDNANYFYQASVTITGSSTTATVTHTTHGLTTGEYVWIEGAEPDVYNGQYQIIVTDANTYTYTTNETIGTSPATGTITSTFLVISGLTNASGVITDNRSWTVNQPILGRIRKSTSSPLYKTAGIVGTIDSTTGLSSTIQMISDE